MTPTDKRRKQLNQASARWNARNPEKRKAVAKRARRKVAATVEGRAKSLLRLARRREKIRGVELSKRLPPVGSAPYKRMLKSIIRQIEGGFHGRPYDLSVGSGRAAAFGPSLSRKNHRNPRYVRNWTIEPHALNMMKGPWDQETLAFLAPFLHAKPGASHGTHCIRRGGQRTSA